MKKLIGIGFVVATLAGAMLVHSALEYGFSARDQPMALEAWIARGMRVLAIPTSDRERANPVVASASVLKEARQHFADHCAICHGNDGSGATKIGSSLYPKAPDMRAAPTQELADGELFSIIRNGIRLSGMPAFGVQPADEDTETWGLVHFLRHLADLSPAELAEMENWNPKGRADIERERDIENFLNGGAPPGDAPSKHEHQGDRS